MAYKKINNKFLGQIKPRNLQQVLAFDMLQDKDSTIKCLTGRFGCVDCDTEFFNGEKWKKISEWDNEKVLEYNIENQTALLSYPIKYIKEPCDYLWQFESKYGLNQCLSDEHNVLYQTPKGVIYKKQFSEIKEKHEKSSTGFDGKFFTTFNYSGHGINLSDDEIRLMCAVICDGHFNNTIAKTARCIFNLKKDRKKQRLLEICNRLNIECKICDSTAKGYNCYYVTVPREEKEFTSYWYNCNQHQLQVICDEIMFWDGNVNYSETNHIKRQRFSTTNKITADFVQFAFSACGHRATIGIQDRRGRKYVTGGKEYTRKSIEYAVVVSNNKQLGLCCENKYAKRTEIKKYKTLDGYKYCFTMPTGNLILRRNNCIFITGNSGKSYLMISNALDLIEKHQFDKIVFVRNNIEVKNTQPIGFLPGESIDKLLPWAAVLADHCGGEIALKMLIEQGKIEIVHMGFIRGRDFKNSIIYCTECENMTKEHIQLLIGRVGENSQLWLDGDYKQIDGQIFTNNNGLKQLINKLQGDSHFGYVKLEKTERSETAALADKLD